MSLTPIIFDVPEESLAALDEIAANMEADRATVLREAVGVYLSTYAQEKSIVEQAEQDIASGNFLAQQEVEARFKARFQRNDAA
jgi:predicted transcriptional regulator